MIAFRVFFRKMNRPFVQFVRLSKLKIFTHLAIYPLLMMSFICQTKFMYGRKFDCRANWLVFGFLFSSYMISVKIGGLQHSPPLDPQKIEVCLRAVQVLRNHIWVFFRPLKMLYCNHSEGHPLPIWKSFWRNPTGSSQFILHSFPYYDG